MQDPSGRLPSCGWFYDLYGAAYWGGTKFTSLLMMRDADDDGVPDPVPNPSLPRVNDKKEGPRRGYQPIVKVTTVGESVYNEGLKPPTSSYAKP